MAEARIGRFRQAGNAPCPVRIAKEDPQDCGRLRGEDRPQRAGFGLGPVCNRSIDIDIVEGEVSVPDEIQVGDIMISADRPRFWREVGDSQAWGSNVVRNPLDRTDEHALGSP